MIKLQKKQPVPDPQYKETLDRVLTLVNKQEKTFIRAYQDVVKELGVRPGDPVVPVV